MFPKFSATHPSPGQTKRGGKGGNLRHGWRGCGERFGGIWEGWASCLQDGGSTEHGHAPSRDPPGKQNRARASRQPASRPGTSIKIPKFGNSASSLTPSREQPKILLLPPATRGQAAPGRGPGRPHPLGNTGVTFGSTNPPRGRHSDPPKLPGVGTGRPRGARAKPPRARRRILAADSRRILPDKSGKFGLLPASLFASSIPDKRRACRAPDSRATARAVGAGGTPARRNPHRSNYRQRWAAGPDNKISFT